ncbi:GntR family transcriptional regulator [Acuticoccus sp. M5D2P5]|uniref:GntR family transcriptional regulator n=1 Tax=Acuticoccus kalidii TaxID=2910977 RepID=UPI001F354B3D|nr:GntR family transcriptional regulator [Acuticoccus kalidii]MCF3932085.1 GntR family transcriptional regulator [Acuticoccus kalidii]
MGNAPKERRTAKERTVDRVYAEVREQILAGTWGPESRLTEEMLAERYNVSRTPVRAALHKLASDGFIEMIPRAGAVVRARTLAEAIEIYDVRSLLESEAAGLAARRRSEEEVATLYKIADEMEAIAEKSGQVPALSQLNQELHHLILRASRNRTLEESALRLIDIGFVINTYTNFRRTDMARTLADHRALIQAIEAQDEIWASSVMRAHIATTRNALKSTMRP